MSAADVGIHLDQTASGGWFEQVVAAEPPADHLWPGHPGHAAVLAKSGSSSNGQRVDVTPIGI